MSLNIINTPLWRDDKNTKMFSSKIPTDRGIIKMIILIVIAILILSYFGYNIRSLVNSPNTQDNFSYVGGVVVDVWNNYLKVPATYAWDFFINMVWNPAVHNLMNINNGQPPTVQLSLPTMVPTTH